MDSDMCVLEGINVLQTCVNLPGPAACARLRDLGASVMKVEPPTGDPLQRSAPKWYEQLSAGMQLLTLDLKQAPGRRDLDRLLGSADLLVTSSRPSSLARLGMNSERLREQYPRLCHVSIVGYATPLANVPGHDLGYQVSAGLLGEGADQRPALPPSLIADLGGAERAVSAALGLLFARTRTGQGGSAEVSLAETARWFALPRAYGLTAPDGLLGGAYAPYNLYSTADGWVAMAALEPQFWARFIQAIQRPDLADPARASVEAVSAEFRVRPSAFWLTLAREHDLPIAAPPEVAPAG